MDSMGKSYNGDVENLGLSVHEDSLTPKQQAHALPHNSGVYLMRDGKGTVIYVGKAKDLHRRVTSYFLANRPPKTAALVAKIRHIDHIITGNEYEALVLENNLIKKYNPHYNIDLKDGKSYPVIRITHEDFPKVFKTRRLVNDGSKYFGPYPDAGKLDTFLDLIQKIFPLRRCGTPLKKQLRPCLYYHLGLCGGPCAGLVSKERYRSSIDEVERFLSGDDQSLKQKLKSEMEADAKAFKFEEAAKKRDMLVALEAVGKEQEVQDFTSEARDYAAIEMRSPLCTVSIMQMRDGRLIGRALYRAETFDDETETLMDFLVRYYSDGKKLPRYLYVSHEIDVPLISEFFKKQFGGDLEVTVPTDGRHYRILRMAVENARSDVERRLKSRDNTKALELLQKELDLPTVPTLIEGYDIAQLSGKYTVASMISFRDGNPNREGYRRFNIKGLDGKIDDFESMREATARRYTRVVNENLEHPGLILIDGGKGQVMAVREILDSLGLTDVPIVGLAKDMEEIAFDHDRPPLLLDPSDEGLRVLIAVRDECHRFATTANQNQRSVDATFKVLESIDGVGPARSQRLMKTFGSLDELMRQSPEDLASKGKVPKAVAERILRTLKL
ncbi:MAG: excinuclease ABC subunit UvrC [Sphaerochaetaceae bacterium]|nr:excinuclease ABC subunit UvrC [Sphaerochaetaceae bacterium]